jgi:hypothetical protein
MRSLYYFAKSALVFARHQVWTEFGLWTKADAVALASFWNTPAGIRLKQQITATVVRQQAYAVTQRKPEDLQYEAAYCAGQKAMVAIIEGLADHTKLSETGDTEADPATN